MTAKKRGDVEAVLKQLEEHGLHAQLGGFEVETIPTGISSFDMSTGVGGIPRRRITVLEGEEGSGKTLILLALIARVQASGGWAAFIDAEHALTPSFASMLGVRYDDLVISRPRTLNESYDTAKALVETGLFDVVGLDSAPALTTEEGLRRSASDSAVRAEEAQVHSSELKKITGLLDSRTAFVIINQLREDPNPPQWYRRQNMKRLYAPGGRAIRHYASLRVQVKTLEFYRDSSGRKVGHKVATSIEKNKVAQPYGRAVFDLRYATGLDLASDLVETGVQMGVITKKSSWYYLTVADPETGEVTGDHRWNGRQALEEAVRGDPELQQALQSLVSHVGEIHMEEDGEDEDDADNPSGWDRVS